jgi:hypothetical protein
MVTINEKTYTKFLSEEFCDENISSLAIKNIVTTQVLFLQKVKILHLF